LGFNIINDTISTAIVTCIQPVRKLVAVLISIRIITLRFQDISNAIVVIIKVEVIRDSTTIGILKLPLV